WVLEPSDVSIPLGGTAVVPCSAQGFPPPEITWQRKTASGEWVSLEKLTESFQINHRGQERNFHSIPSDFIPQTGAWNVNDLSDETSTWNGHDNGHPGADGRPSFRKVYNGSLVLASAARNYEGLYLCQSENGVGASLSKVVQVAIHEPPWFTERGRRLVQVEV
ncbi:Immunoglobulin-like domain, partial [Trinorchestia longiramus]